MKWIMVMGAVLALSPVAFGAAHFSLATAGGSATAISVLPGTTISVDLNVVADDTIASFSAFLNASATGVIDGSTRTWKSPPGDAFFESGADDLGGGLDTLSLDIGGVSNTSADWASSCTIETFSLIVDAGAENQTLTITVAEDPTLSAYVEYSPGSTEGEFGDGYEYGTVMGGTELTFGSYEVNIIPEPASMLLLAGALPFLRRRRSA